MTQRSADHAGEPGVARSGRSSRSSIPTSDHRPAPPSVAGRGALAVWPRRPRRATRRAGTTSSRPCSWSAAPHIAATDPTISGVSARPSSWPRAPTSSPSSTESPPIAGIVGHADLADGAPSRRGARCSHRRSGRTIPRDPRCARSATEPEVMMIAGASAEGKYRRSGIPGRRRRGSGERGLTYDTWHYHHQMHEILDLARAVPDTMMVLDHFGTPCRRRPVRNAARRDLRAVEDRHHGDRQLRQRRGEDRRAGDARQRLRLAHRRTAADVGRVRRRAGALLPAHDRGVRPGAVHVREQLSGRPVLAVVPRALERWLKKIAAEFSDDEQDAMFSGTACRVYSIDL